MASSSGSPTSTLTSTPRSDRDRPNKRRRSRDQDEQDVFCPKLQYVDTDKSTVENLLECPICTNLCIPPIHICKEGHHVCNDCHNRLRVCATCKSPYLGGKNIFLENYFEQNCFFSCSFMGEGCHRDMIQGRDLRAHQESCQFRPLQCICCTVETEVAFSKYMDHLEAIHHVYQPVAGCSEYEYTLTMRNLSRINSYSWKPKSFKFEGHVFIVMNELKNNCFGAWIYIFGNSASAKRYYSRISIVSKRNTAQDQKYSLSWEGPVIPIRSMGARGIMQEGMCLSTSKNFILKIAQGTQQISDPVHASSTLNFQSPLARAYFAEGLSTPRSSAQNNTSSTGVDSTDNHDIEDGSRGPISSWTVKYELLASNNSAEAEG